MPCTVVFVRPLVTFARPLVVGAALLCCCAVDGAAQDDVPPGAPGSMTAGRGLRAGDVLEISGSERVLAGRETIGLSRADSLGHWLTVLGVERGALGPTGASTGGTGLRVELGWRGSPRRSVVATFDDRGRVLDASDRFERSSRPADWNDPPGDSIASSHAQNWLRPQRSGRPRRQSRVGLPATAAWDLLPVLPTDRAPAPGDRWTDTLALEVREGDFLQRWSGVRSSTVVGDTVVDGISHLVVVDSTDVVYVTRALRYQRATGAFEVRTRSMSGLHAGRYLLDPEAGVARVRRDMTVLQGMQLDSLPDGRTVEVPVSWEGGRRLRLVPEADVDAWRAERDAAYRALRASFRSPTGRSALWRRLRAGDPALADSIRNEVIAGSTLADRRSAFELFESAFPVEGRHAATLDLLLEIGDTTGALFAREDHLERWSSRPWSLSEVEGAIADLRDPQRSRGRGLDEQVLLRALADGLVSSAPAAVVDGTPACMPEACAFLAGLGPDEASPNVRDLGLLARFATDPIRWRDTIAERDDAFFRHARNLIDGVVRTGGTDRVSIPAEGAAWREWERWLRGGERTGDPVRALPSLYEDFRTRVRMVELLTGRDVGAEIGRHWADATADTARLVFGTIRAGLGGRPAVAEIEAGLRSSSWVDRLLARQALHTLDGARVLDQWRVPPGTVTTEILDAALRIMLDGEPRWADLHPADSVRYGFRRLDAEALGQPLHVGADAPPDELVAAWGDRVTFESSDAVRARFDRQEDGVFLLPVVEMAGPLVRVIVVREHWNESPRDGYLLPTSGSFLAYLLRTDDGWRAVAHGEGIS